MHFLNSNFGSLLFVSYTDKYSLKILVYNIIKSLRASTHIVWGSKSPLHVSSSDSTNGNDKESYH